MVERRPLVFWMAFASLVVVLVNAWMGARVVKYHRTVEDHFLALKRSGSRKVVRRY